MIVLYHHREGGRWASAKEKQTQWHFECYRKVANSEPARTVGRFGCIHRAKSPQKAVFTSQAKYESEIGILSCSKGADLTFRLLFELVSNNLKPFY